ncbi:MAG: hypothetical protein DRP58_08665 [Spirochaetes bacterium]|nr:MAG: hypothetical protein DRP58_08665 [Spirochaetota bacterium]
MSEVELLIIKLSKETTDAVHRMIELIPEFDRLINLLKREGIDLAEYEQEYNDLKNKVWSIRYEYGAD